MLGVVLTTIFSTTKLLAEFLDCYYFDFSTITVIVDNCTTITVLNDKFLFLEELKPTTSYGIITVGGTNYKLTYIGTAKMLVYYYDGI